MRDAVAVQTHSNPDATALADAATGQSWTYTELDAAVEETAGRLAALGVEPGDRVAVLLGTRPAFARLAFACARLGAVLVPLDVRRPRSELAAQVETVRPVLVACGADTAADARALDAPAASVDAVADSAAGDWEAAAAGDLRAFGDTGAVGFSPADLAWDDTRALLFTSGTTGSPKAVRLTYGNVAASAVASAFRLGVLPDDRWLCPLPLYHTGGLAVVLRSALYGTTAVLTRGFDADAVLDALHGHDCTGVSLVPTMLSRLLDAGRFPESLRFALVGGAPARPDLVERALDAGVPVCPTYGLTEAASQVATLGPGQAAARPESVGRPLLGTEVTVLDDDGEPLPPGEAGELAVAGPTVTPGYVSGPEAESADGDAFCEYGLRTGDYGHLDGAGFLHVAGRRTDRIVTGGENVHPDDVAAVLRDHSGVEAAAVVGVPDDEWGERVGALVVAPGDELDADALRTFCEDRLADYEVPRAVAFVEEIPRTASGTVDREAATDLLADGT